MSPEPASEPPPDDAPDGGRGEAAADVGGSLLRRRVGLVGGGALFLLLLVLPAPDGLSPEGWHTAAVAVLMAVWWITEAIPIPATALLPLPLFPLFGVLEMDAAAAPYANELIFLFMGGFLIALAMERWGLHRRIALAVVGAVGTGPRRLVLGFMLATAFLSMWISNTATATMMLPIALAIGEMFRPRRAGDAGEAREAGEAGNGGGEGDAAGEPGGGPFRYAFGTALMLGIAYAASIGGVATLIGTPPNAVFAGAARELLDVEIGFVEWMMVGLPVAAVALPVTWAILVFVLHPPGELGDGAAGLIRRKREELGPANRGERIVGVVFALTAAAWLVRAPKTVGGVTVPGIQSVLPSVTDATIAMGAALLLFTLPVRWREGTFVLNWRWARRLPWGVLVLFGGGFSLARGMDRSGLAVWIGNGVAGLEALPVVLLVGAVAALFVFLTEITSNTATSTMAMPVMVGAAAGLGFDPVVLMATAALASSMAFMLPVATPPNAIVFGSGYITIPQMARAGLLLNLLTVAVVTVAVLFLVPGLGR